ncbi:bifunctional metallophosphatase/5'-nucleotidase [Sphingomonas sp. ASV193]|uniref:bifunctional metallophosphatase/5'-nucleotidase n=1 Tax=Sphingomonas sp. ASV193 TaxID=3144405 RepID=UPI0032E915C6
MTRAKPRGNRLIRSLALRRYAPLAAVFLAAACSQVPTPPPTVPPPPPPTPIEVQLLALNDFHGNLEVPPPFDVTDPGAPPRKLVSGGAAHLAATIEKLREGHRYTDTVAAGDLIGASPLTSALFLDEPTIHALDAIGLDFVSVGNHEFDKGVNELKRIQDGGCAVFTNRTPCGLEPYAGAHFHYLAANVFGPDGKTVFPATGIRQFGPIKVGFIGMTLKGTGNLVTPSGVKGLTFADEAATANALVPMLKAEGADTIVLLIHQGGKTPTFTEGKGCAGLSGDIIPIVQKLDPAIATVISGHTHWAYVCQAEEAGSTGNRLLTSAGKYGGFVTDIRLHFDPATHALVSNFAMNVTVGTGAEDGKVKAIVDRYVAAAAPLANRVVGRLSAAAPYSVDDAESPAANLIADAFLAATRAPAKGGAQLALVNASGVRVGLPAGDIAYKDVFRMMPFNNGVVVETLTGAQIARAIEQQYAQAPHVQGGKPAALAVSQGVSYTVDLSRAPGSRVTALALGGRPIDPAARYRVAMNNYMASGGDGLSALAEGRDLVDTGIDVDALIAWIANGRTPPAANRIRVVP